MGRKLSNDEFLIRVREKFPDYKVLSSYSNKRTNVMVSCPDPLHNPYQILPLVFLNGGGCPLCNIERLRVDSSERFKHYMTIEFPDYTLLSNYVRGKDKIKVSCGNLEHPDFWITPYSLKNGSGCIKCAGCCPEAARTSFLNELSKSGYKLIGEYVSAAKKVEICCDKGHKYFVDSRSFRKGNRCLVCNGNSPNTGRKNFEHKVVKSGFTLVTPYKSKRTKVTVECEQGHKQELYPSVFKSENYKCRYCVDRFYGFDNTRPANLYLQFLSRTDDDKCFKYGITNREVQERLHEQELVSRYDHELVYVLHHEDGKLIEELERKISERFKEPFLTKQDLRNGYRETVSFADGREVFEMMKKFEKDYLEIEGKPIDGYYSYGRWC